MSLSIEDNLREQWSRITDTSILRPRDELRLIGERAMATLAVLDSHDPEAILRRKGISWKGHTQGAAIW